MRWPLKQQLLLRSVLIVLFVICVLTFANIHSSIVLAKKNEIDRTTQIVDSVQRSRFPMTANVLENMKALSGAEFIVTDELGNVQHGTYRVPEMFKAGDFDAPVAVSIDGQEFYQATAKQNKFGRDSPILQTHILVPRQSETQILWKASKSPLLVAAIVLPITMLIAYAVASQITQPIFTICDQTDQLSQGKALDVPARMSSRNDEVGDLIRTMNTLAGTIKQHGEQLIANERLQTRIQVGNGIAHNLRNSSTGCLMAIELLATEHAFIRQTEEYEVARRQLGLIDDYIKRFLTLSKKSTAVTQAPTHLPKLALIPILESTVQLLRPMAKHLDVVIDLDQVTDTSANIELDDARQVVMNLVGNAITAAKEAVMNSSSTPRSEPPKVSISLHQQNDSATLLVTDNGNGPPPEIADHIFESFVSGSRSGTGLGLVQVAEIADQIGGKVSWRRQNDRTIFEFRFAIMDQNTETKAIE